MNRFPTFEQLLLHVPEAVKDFHLLIGNCSHLLNKLLQFRPRYHRKLSF
jgi:hypothetical protein